MDGVVASSERVTDFRPRNISFAADVLLLNILSFIADPQTLSKAAMVSHNFCRVASFDRLWKLAIVSIFHSSETTKLKALYIAWKIKLTNRRMSSGVITELRRPLFPLFEGRIPQQKVRVDRPLVKADAYRNLAICSRLGICSIFPPPNIAGGCDLVFLGHDGSVSRVQNLPKERHMQLTASGQWLTQVGKKIRVRDLHSQDMSHFSEKKGGKGSCIVNEQGEVVRINGTNLFCYKKDEVIPLGSLFKNVKVIPINDAFLLLGPSKLQNNYLLAKYIPEENRVEMVGNYPLPPKGTTYMTTCHENRVWLICSLFAADLAFFIDIETKVNKRYYFSEIQSYQEGLAGCQFTEISFEGKYLSCSVNHMRFALGFTFLLDMNNGSVDVDKHSLKSYSPNPILPCIIGDTRVSFKLLNRAIVLSDFTGRNKKRTQYMFDHGVQVCKRMKNQLVVVDTLGKFRIHKL